MRTEKNETEYIFRNIVMYDGLYLTFGFFCPWKISIDPVTDLTNTIFGYLVKISLNVFLESEEI